MDIVTRVNIFIVCFAFILMMPLVGRADDSPSHDEIYYFDDPADRFYSRSELKKLYMSYQKIPLSEISNANNNWEIDCKLYKKYIEKLNKKADDFIDKLAKKYNKGEDESFAINDIFEHYGYPTGMKPGEIRMLIRRDHNALTFFNPENDIEEVKEDGAFVSLGQNLDNSSGLWKVQGCALFPVRLPVSELAFGEGNTKLAGANFVPSVEIDRQSSKGSDIDKLVFRAGLEGLFDTRIDDRTFSQYPSLLFAYNTDSGFDASIYEIEMDWRPFWLPWALGIYQYHKEFFPWIKYQFSFNAHGAYGRVDDVGNYDNLEEGEDYFRMGPVVGLYIIPNKKELYDETSPYKDLLNHLCKLSLSVGYSYMFGLIGEPRSSRLVSFSLAYEFSEKLQLSSDLTYRYGEVPITQEQVDEIILGLSWAY